MLDVIIIGAGITGLAAAHAFLENGKLSFKILEASEKTGGKIVSERVELPGYGTLILEHGPDSFTKTKPDALNLARKLELNDMVDIGSSGYNFDILDKGVLFPVPKNIGLKIGMLETQKTKLESGAMFSSFISGMQTLTDEMERRVLASLEFNQSVTSIEAVGDAWQVTTGKSEFFGKSVFLTVDPNIAAKILPESAHKAKIYLSELRTTHSASVYFAFKSGEPALSKSSFGFLVPDSENRTISGVTIVSQKMPWRVPKNIDLVRVFLRGTIDTELLEATALQEFRDILSITSDPIFAKVIQLKDAYPAYGERHGELIRDIEDALPKGIFVGGGSYRGIGIPDCIRQGQLASAKILVQSE